MSTVSVNIVIHKAITDYLLLLLHTFGVHKRSLLTIFSFKLFLLNKTNWIVTNLRSSFKNKEL